MSILGEHLDVLFTLVALLICVFSFVHISKVHMTTKELATAAVLIALAMILSFIKIYHFPQGGSVTLAAMLPLLFISFAYGPAVGILAGFVYGVLHFILSPYILHPVQVLFDYPLPYMAMGLAGFFKDKYYLGTIVALMGRLFCHIVSGVVFFANYAPKGVNPLIYSIIYNGSYLLLDLIICLLVIKILSTRKLLKRIMNR